MDAYVLIQTEARGEPLAQRLRGIPGVLSAEDVRGAFDAVVLARTGPQQDLLDGIIGQIRSLPGVTRALPAPLLRSASEAPGDGPFERRPEHVAA